ncbi:glycoside hydrolase family 18 protein [Durotheca rogersii]|uniref:glycoside hydrolase family 18 protein n=1 Tax=Durotheca rogersii TaxID=419775 RepID=UPI00221F426B|nr:glycoside hydrolase family 18 protein [Durotheca rogersii]KAI5860562.1 glycoside hydrolase family 18 protein [Durotheca rogersii]
MSSTPRFVNAVYYPGWSVYKGFSPSSMQIDCVDQVFYAFTRLNPDGSLRFLDEFGDSQKPVDGEQGCLRALAKLKRATPGLKTLVSIGGGGGSAEFPLVAADPACLQTFARSCRMFVDEFEFDGVDVDWEHPTTPRDGANFLALIASLREALPSPQYLITTALPTGEYCLRNIDLYVLGQLLDTLNLMGYDFTGPWTAVSGHHAQLFPQLGPQENIPPALCNSCHRGVTYLTSHNFPPGKILLGVPAYARSFGGACGINEQFQSAEEMEYKEIPREWTQAASVHRDIGAASYVDYSPDGKGFVSFDVPDTVRQKADYVKQMGLAGLFYWTSAGDLQGAESLVRAGYETLNAQGGSVGTTGASTANRT